MHCLSICVTCALHCASGCSSEEPQKILGIFSEKSRKNLGNFRCDPFCRSTRPEGTCVFVVVSEVALASSSGSPASGRAATAVLFFLLFSCLVIYFGAPAGLLDEITVAHREKRLILSFLSFVF